MYLVSSSRPVRAAPRGQAGNKVQTSQAAAKARMAATAFFQWRSKTVGSRSQLYAMRVTFLLAANKMVGSRCNEIPPAPTDGGVIACGFLMRR